MISLNFAKQKGFGVALFIGSSHFPNLDAARVIVETAKTLPNWHFVLLGDCGLTISQEYSTKGGVTHNVHCLGLVSEYEIGNRFIERLGDLQKRVTRISGENWLTINGRAIKLDNISFEIPY